MDKQPKQLALGYKSFPLSAIKTADGLHMHTVAGDSFTVQFSSKTKADIAKLKLFLGERGNDAVSVRFSLNEQGMAALSLMYIDPHESADPIRARLAKAYEGVMMNAWNAEEIAQLISKLNIERSDGISR